MPWMWAPRALTQATRHQRPQEVPTNPRTRPCQNPPVSVMLWVERGVGPLLGGGAEADKGPQAIRACEIEVAVTSHSLLPLPLAPCLSPLHTLVLPLLHEADIMQVTRRSDNQAWF